MKAKSKKRDLKLVIVILLFVVTIGYATLQTNLTINGSSKINNSTWNVHFNNPTVTTGSVLIDTTKYANAQAATKDDATHISYNVLLSEPGDFYEFTVPVQNEGTIDAMIDEVISTIQIGTGAVTTINSSSDIPSWLNYSVTYTDGVVIANNHRLNAGKTEKYKVRVEFKKDITNAQLQDAAGKELHLTFEVEYVQKDGNAINKPLPPFTGIKYGVYPIANKVYLNQAVPENTILHLDEYGAIDDWVNENSVNKEYTMPFYLKHVIENDIVKESYVVFDISYDAAYNNSDMVMGTHELRGGLNEENTSEKTNFMHNSKILYDAFGGRGCSKDFETIDSAYDSSYYPNPDWGFRCVRSGFDISVLSNGDVEVASYDESNAYYHCNIDEDYSYCY